MNSILSARLVSGQKRHQRRRYAVPSATLAAAAVLLAAFLQSHTVLAQASPAPWVHESFDGAPCQGRRQGYGPYDYLERERYHHELNLVEMAHFTPGVERLQRRAGTGTLAGDLDYTISAWPNHHRALHAMMRLQRQESGVEVRRMRERGTPPVECHLYRAINFSPRDATVHMLMGMHLYHLDKPAEAAEWYQKALDLQPQHIEAQYNYALLLVDMGDYDRARSLAERVYAQGFPLEGLRRKLERAEQGQEHK